MSERQRNEENFVRNITAVVNIASELRVDPLFVMGTLQSVAISIHLHSLKTYQEEDEDPTENWFN